MLSQLHRERLARCGRLMKEAGLDVLLLTKPANMFYLTGDGRLCAYAMITPAGQVALGVPVTDVRDVREITQADLIAGFDDEVGMIHSIAHHFAHFGIERGVVGLEYTFLTQSMMSMVTHPHAKPAEVTAKDGTHVMTELRIAKDDGEIHLMRAAGKVADAGMKAAVEAARPGVTESQVAAAAEYAMRHAGAEGAWRTYVSSGPRTSIAHGLPTNRKLQAGDLVMIDAHPIVDNYSADICRTICLGRPAADQQVAYDLFLRAQQSTVAQVKAGAKMADLEEIYHGMLRAGGHADHIFGPPIHGVGIEFEESPLPAGHAFFHGEAAPPPLAASTVIAVGNCGLYVGPWGIRVEDTVVAGPASPELLTSYPRTLAR